MSYIFGTDVFSGYGKIDWKAAAAGGVRFCWVKSAEGNEPRRNDTRFAENVAGCRANGIAVGAYFFPYPLPSGPGLPAGRGPLEQAERFFSVTAGLGSQAGDLSPAVDAEWPPPEEWAKWGCTAPQISEWLREHCEAVALLFGRLPVIYTYPWWWRALAAGADVSWAQRYPLWMASYTHFGPGVPPTGKAPYLPDTWETWDAWQYSANGSTERVPGIPVSPVDRDVIRDEATLRKLCGYREHDPDADTQPELVPSIPPRDGARTVTPWDIARGVVPLGRRTLDGDLPDSDPEEPDSAA